MKYWPIILLVFLLAACNSASARQPVTIPEESETSEPNAITQPIETDSPGDDEATDLMYQLLQGDEAVFQSAIETIIAAKDTRFIAVFIEILRANQLGLMRNTTTPTPIDALETLSGQTFGRDWAAWIEWYGKTELTPPPGFTGWKGQLLGKIDQPLRLADLRGQVVLLEMWIFGCI
jgi:hypothetical protein